jgi:hypothetical protein
MMGLKNLLRELNSCYETEYTLDRKGMKTLLTELTARDLDFGTAYAYVRAIWYGLKDESDIWARFKYLEVQGATMASKRQKHMSGEVIKSPFGVYPRRVWDIYANRVVPYHFSLAIEYKVWKRTHWAVSHSWTNDMVGLDTLVNGKEWPVPFPTGITIEDVREELIRLIPSDGRRLREYVWLDVLCLRQQSNDASKEVIREKEWAIDVPTIATAYKDVKYGAFGIIRYFNGLGKPFKWKEWDSDRHWINRTWTLQENHREIWNAGLPESTEDIFDVGHIRGKKKTYVKNRLDTLQSPVFWTPFDSPKPSRFMEVIQEVSRRHSTNPVDKTTVVATLLQTQILAFPRYRANISPEKAWSLFLCHMTPSMLTMLLFCFPLPGDQGHLWRPSWNQLMHGESLPNIPIHNESISLIEVDESNFAHYTGHIFIGQLVLLGQSERISGADQTARIIVTLHGKQHNIGIFIRQDTIPLEGLYTFVGNHTGDLWVICTKDNFGRLKKVSVARIRSGNNSKPRDLNLGTKDECTFL